MPELGMHSRRALAHCAQMGRSSLHLSYSVYGQSWLSVAVSFIMCLSIAYLPLTAGEAMSERKVSRFLAPSAPRTTTYHPVLDLGAIAAYHSLRYQPKHQL
jgi:hypothetical protein